MAEFYPKLYKTQMRVGLFSLLIIIALVVSYLWLTSRLNLSSQQDIDIYFEDVSGLEVGDKIMFRGMEVGRVRQIELREDAILVKGKISRGVKLMEGAKFVIGDSSLMGGTHLSIIQGDGSVYLQSGQKLYGESPAGIMHVLGKAATAVDDLTALLVEIRSDDGLLDKANKLMNSADASVRYAGDTALALKTELTQTLGKVDQLSSKINEVVLENEAEIHSILSKSPAALDNVNSTLDSLQALSAKLHLTMDSINQGEGMAAKMLNDRQLYEKVVRSVENLDALIEDVRANPRKYIKFSLF